MKGNYYKLQKSGQSIRLLTGVLFVMLMLAFQQQAFSQTCPNFSYNLDQGRNGDEDSPENPVEWVNGNLNASQSHFVEGYSIPYRAILTGLTPGQCFCIRIEWDIRHSGVNALDYITSYPNCTNSLMDDPSHQGSFMHGPECVNPVLGTTMNPAVFTTYPIPSPTNNISALGNMMPVYSFDNQAEANRVLTMFGGTITSASYFVQGSLTSSQTSTSMDICFTADNDSAIMAWGGHIASRLEWGVGNSAGSISGSPYHMRILGMKCCSQTVYSGGNQDRSLQAAAVIPAPIAIITGLDTVCVGNNNTVMITTNQPGTTTYEWAIASAGTTGAAIVGSDTSQQVVISATAPGEYIICGTITINGVSATACDTVTVLQAPVCSITGDGLVCGGQSTTFTASAANSYLWNTGETTQSIEVSASGTYTVTVSNSFGCSSTCTKDLSYSDAIDIEFATSSVNCFGGSDGSIDVTATGGSGNLTYEWNTGATTEDISGASAGTYTVTVTDENGCSATESTNVSQPTFELSLSETHTDVLCNNGSDGSIDLTVNGGTPAYSYDWSDGSTDEDPTGLSAGTYNVIVTDANGCTTATSVEIEEPSLLVINETHENVACNGGNDGSIDITVSGGTLNYSYAWSNGSTAEDITGLSAGNYTVTVTDGNGCTSTETIAISQAGTLEVNETHVDVLCYNGTNGSIDLSVSGGTPGYSYDWNDGASTEDRSGLSAGIYTVTVTDNNGCSAIENITISQPDELTLSEQHGNVSCYGGSNGFIAITTNGGTEPYDFSWNNGAVTEDLTGLSSGTYTIVVTDENGCTATETVQITQPDELVITDGDITNVSCFEGENGAIDITVAGGTQPYDYSWSNGEITEDLTDLAAGTYTVVVTDENGCSTTDSYTVTEPTLLTVSETNIDVTCNGLDNGSIDITVNGGTPSYSYLWSNGSGLEDISNLSPGIYTVTVTDDNGCTASTSAEISQPDSLQLMEQHTDETCNESNDGSINLGVMGGTTDYNYNWSNGATSQDISSLSAGTYTVTVTDANNCSATTSVQITQPDPLEISGSATDALCNGAGDGTIGITVTGGTPDYSYAWSNNATTEDLSGLAAGTYTVVVTDENGCSATESFTVEQPSTLAVSGQATDALCNGSADGSVGITVTGGTEPFTFVWSNGASSEDISGLAAGTYTVTVTDGNNCSVTESYTVGEPDALDITGQAVDALCNGSSDGSVGITVTGGTQPYTYAWSNNETTEDLTGLAAGVYTVVVTDDNGCSATESFTVGQPDLLTISGQASDALCYGSADGSVGISVNGGTAPYTFAWSNNATTEDISGLAAGNYTVVVTDDNGCSATESYTVNQPDSIEITGSATDALCNGAGDGSIGITVTGGTPDYSYAWSNNATTEDLSGLAAGTYTVVVTDENGCSATESFTVEQPSTLAVSGQATDALCNGSSDGSIGITVTGGTEPFNFVWSNGASSEDISGLAAGTYTVTVTDGNNCSVTESYTVGEPDALDITGQAVDALCNGSSDGSVGITVTGGTQPYTYAWSNNATTEDLTGLAAGVYTVVVTDDNGCSATESFSVGQPDLLTISGQASDALCYGSADGSVGISVNGGTAPYSFAWSNNATTEDISGLAAGNYTVVVTDDNGCSATESYSVNQPDSIEITGSATDALCNGAGDGSIGITVTGGTPDYSYAWSNNATTEDLSGLAAGTYTVVVTDENGCSATESFTVAQPSSLAVSGQVTDALCNGGNGSVEISISGGTQPYSINWSNGATSEDLTAVPAGSYTVVVTDANNCSATQTFNVGQPAAIVVDATGECSPCNILGEATASVTASGGTGNLTYLWSNGATTTSISNLFSGNYTVTVTDENGCTATGTVILDCDPKCQYTTFTMGGWGANPNGNNPGVYLHANFSSAFPNGLNIGCNNNLKLTSAQAVTDFLPSGSTASMLPSGNMINPGQGYSNVLSGQLVAATLSVTFDYYDAQFAGEPMNLGDLEIGSGTFAGWTVNQLLDSANAFIGGCGSMYSASDFNSALTSVNEDFDNGNVHTGYLLCPSEELTATVTSTDVTCSNVCDGTASVSVMFGTAPYNYMWSNGATTASVTGLCEGTYTVTVEDDKKCTVTLNVTIGKKGVDISLTFVVTDVTCNGSGDGAIDLTVNGGTAPYGFQWSNGDITEDITNLDAATYTVIVTDKNGCTATGFETVAEPDLLVVTIDSKDNKCSKGKDGEAEASANGGSGAYTYLWSNGETTQMISGLSAGIYTVTVTDANGCTASDSVEIMDLNSWIDISFEVTHAVCAGSSNGEIDATITGGTPGYTYLWSNGATSEDITGLPGGNYTLTVTDANGCSNSVATYVIDPAPIVLGTKVDDAVCGLNGVIDLTVSGGWAPYTYLWSNGKTTEDLTKLEPKAYTVTVTDVRGCTAQTTATVGGTKQLKIQLKSVTHASDTACDGAIDIKVINGTAPYTYKWQKINTSPIVNMGTSQDLLNVCPAMYRVRVIDAEGCIKYRKIEVKYLKDVLAPVKVDYSSLQTPATGIAIQNIFPSPASDIANVVITSEKSATASVQVIDIMGQLVLDLEDVQLESGMARQIELNVSGLEAGTYMVIVNREGNIATGKLNIAR